MTLPHLEPEWLAANPIVGFRLDLVEPNLKRPWQEQPSLVVHVLRTSLYSHAPVHAEPSSSPFESRLVEGWEVENFIAEARKRQVAAETEAARLKAERGSPGLFSTKAQDVPPPPRGDVVPLTDDGAAQPLSVDVTGPVEIQGTNPPPGAVFFTVSPPGALVHDESESPTLPPPEPVTDDDVRVTPDKMPGTALSDA